jgi:hypothetical protein
MEKDSVLEKLRDGFERAGYVHVDIEGWLVVVGRTADVVVPDFEWKYWFTIAGGFVTVGSNLTDDRVYTRLAAKAGREIQGISRPDEASQWWTETVFRHIGRRMLKVGKYTVPQSSLEDVGKAPHENFLKVRKRIGEPSGWYSHIENMLDASIELIDLMIKESELQAKLRPPSISQPGTRKEWPSEPPPEGSRHKFGPLTGNLTQFAKLARMDARTLHSRNGLSFFYIRKVNNKSFEIWLDSQKSFAVWNVEIGPPSKSRHST